MIRKTIYSLVAIVLAACVLAACGGVTATPQSPLAELEAAPTQQPSQRGVGDTLRILNPQAPTILNPHLSLSLKDTEPSRLTYEPLASYNKDGNLVPFLAAEIPTLNNGGVAADGRSVTWKLKRNVLWSDGQPFTAADVVFTYELVSNPEVHAATAATYGGVASVEALDDYTIRVTFKEATPAWSLPFVGFHGMIMPQHIFEPYNGANIGEAPANTLPVGTGPYRVMPPGIKPQEVLFLGTQLVPTNKIVFEPNPYFRDEDKPYFSRVEWRGGGLANEAARRVLQDGEVDYAFQLGQLTPEELTALEKNGKGQLVTNFGARVDRILLNRTDPRQETEDGERSSLQFPHPYLSDKKVRQAFAHAVDREALAALSGPIGRPTTNNLVAPPQYNSPNTFYEFDLAKAAALLDEAGWVDHDGDGIRDKDGLKMKVVFQGKVGGSVQKGQEIVKDALESIGVEVQLKIVDSAIMFGACADNPDADTCFNADLMVFAIRSASPDPSNYMRFWTCDEIPQKANNWSGLNDERWCSPEYDALYDRVIQELDPEVRQELFIQMNDKLVEDVVMIPTVYLADAQGASRTLAGVDLTPWDMNTWNIMDWRRVTQ